MGGHKPKKVYLYNDKGKFINEFENSKIFANYFNLPTNTMSVISNNLDKDIYMVDDNNFASNIRVGKRRVTLFVAKLKSPYIRKKKPYKKEKIVDCYNLNGELIASFKDEFYLKAMLNNRQINFAKDEFFYSNDLKFKQSD